MASRRKRARRKNSLFVIVIMLLAAVLVLAQRSPDLGSAIEQLIGANTSASSGDEARVHFIDVGQGLSILVQSGEKGVLIDAGEDEYASSVLSFIEDAGVTRLEYIIATHPHSDHIGALPEIIESIGCGGIIMPRLEQSNTPTTKIYERFLNAIADSGTKAIAAVPGEKYTVGSCVLEIVGPHSQSSELNNMSVSVFLNASGVRFMLIGDAQKAELRDIADAGMAYSCDVLQFGHHGSETSLERSFLDSVDADITVISCGADNKYGLPDESVLEYIESSGSQCLRTDELGSISFSCEDGVLRRD